MGRGKLQFWVFTAAGVDKKSTNLRTTFHFSRRFRPLPLHMVCGIRRHSKDLEHRKLWRHSKDLLMALAGPPNGFPNSWEGGHLEAIRIPIPKDNNCLFTSIAYLCCDGVQVAVSESKCRF
jgi:hypothetical protein